VNHPSKTASGAKAAGLERTMEIALISDGKPVTVSLKHEGDTSWTAEIDGKTFSLDYAQLDANTASIIMNNRSLTAHSSLVEEEMFISVGGRRYRFHVPMKDAARKGEGVGGGGAGGDDGIIKTPMPGLIVDVLVSEGDRVTSGQTLVILEAMKMENAVKAPFEGAVKSVKVSKGAQTTLGDVLIEIEKPE